MAEYVDGATDIMGGSVTRYTLNTTTPDQAVIRKIIPGAGISITYTGVDAGTGDVTITATGGGTGGGTGGSAVVSRTSQVFTGSVGQTTFTISGGYTVGNVDVYYNGSKLNTTDFTASNGTTVVLSSPITFAGDIVEVVIYAAATTTTPTTPSTSINPIIVATNTGLTNTNTVVLVNSPLNSTLTITLPLVASANPNGYTIKNIGSGTVYVVGTGGELIDGQSDITFSNKSSINLVPYSGAWYII